MDYDYEQSSEVEALDSIYCGDMQSKFHLRPDHFLGYIVGTASLKFFYEIH